jgi:hypothetical protein
MDVKDWDEEIYMLLNWEARRSIVMLYSILFMRREVDTVVGVNKIKKME